MSWRPGAPAAAVAALALLTLAAVVPLASADHAYSHRFLVLGRVIDADGNPVPGVQVQASYSSVFRPDEPCSPGQPNQGTEAWATTATNPITNAFGEFFYCYHIHSMSRAEPGEATFNVEGQEFKADFDGFMRYVYTELKLEGAHPNANKTSTSQTHTISGRAWESTGAKDHTVEGIRVFGDTLHNQRVNITFTYNDREPIHLNTTTNNYGDFAVRVPVAERPTEGNVMVEIAGNFWNASVGSNGATHVRGQLGETTTSNIPAPAALLVIGVVALAAVALRRRS